MLSGLPKAMSSHVQREMDPGRGASTSTFVLSPSFPSKEKQQFGSVRTQWEGILHNPLWVQECGSHRTQCRGRCSEP